MSIGPPIPEIQHFKNLTLKIQGQGHSSRSQIRYSILSTHIPFVPCRSALPFLGYSNFKIWCWKFKFEVMGEVKVESHNMGPTFSHIPFIPCQSGIPFLSYDFFKIWPWKSRVKVMGEVTVQSHNVGLTSYRLISLWFHVNRPSHSWDIAFSKFVPKDQGPRSNDPGVAQLQV